MISEVLWHSPDRNLTENSLDMNRWNEFEISILSNFLHTRHSIIVAWLTQSIFNAEPIFVLNIITMEFISIVRQFYPNLFGSLSDVNIKVWGQWPLLPTWFSFNPSMDK